MDPTKASDLAMRLIEHLETFSTKVLSPSRPGVIRFPAPYRVPATLAALWEWCRGESACGLFLLGETVLSGFPHAKETEPLHGVWSMALLDPETVAWDLESSGPFEDRWAPDWLKIANDGIGGYVAVDAEGSVFLWRSDIDFEPEIVHESFDRSMAEICDAVDQKRTVVSRDDVGHDVVTCGTWKLFRVSGDGWERAGPSPRT